MNESWRQARGILAGKLPVRSEIMIGLGRGHLGDYLHDLVSAGWIITIDERSVQAIRKSDGRWVSIADEQSTEMRLAMLYQQCEVEDEHDPTRPA